MKESGNSWSDSFKRSVPSMGGTPGDAPSSERSLRDALAKAEQILAESQELALIGSWEWDIATGRLAWTAQTFRNFGEDPHSFVPSFENYTERLHPDDREMMAQTVQGAILSGKPFDYYHRLIRRDGSVRTLHARGRAIYDRDGKPVRMVGTGQDVTERIALEAERTTLAAAEVASRRAGFLRQATLGLYESMDYESRLVQLAKFVVPTLGDWCAVDILEEDGRFNRLAVVHSDPQKIELAKELEERYPEDPELPTSRWNVLASGKPVLFREITDEMIDAGARDPGHAALIRALGLTSFITVPLIAREAKLGTLTIVMAESGRHYDESDVELAMDLSRKAAIAIDNARMHTQLMGKTAELEEQAARLEQVVQELEGANEILNQQAMEMELSQEALQESSSELEMQAHELQRANRELAQSQGVAEKANHAKMEFLAVMSHELRTPLNAINGYTELMEMEIGGLVSETQREYLVRIKKSGQFLLGLINDVLNFAKIDAGSVDIKREPVRLHAILETSHLLIEPQMKARNIAYRYVAMDGTCMAVGDSEKIQQVILNLFTNALKFTDPGGTITLSCESGDGFARIKVADTGRGIPAGKLASIFDPFVQLDRSANAGSQHGVGLGLAISRELARAMGGELTAESEVGKGSVFTLALELSPGP
jgi:signal transduction histidine kinase